MSRSTNIKDRAHAAGTTLRLQAKDTSKTVERRTRASRKATREQASQRGDQALGLMAAGAALIGPALPKLARNRAARTGALLLARRHPLVMAATLAVGAAGALASARRRRKRKVAVPD